MCVTFFLAMSALPVEMQQADDAPHAMQMPCRGDFSRPRRLNPGSALILPTVGD